MKANNLVYRIEIAGIKSALKDLKKFTGENRIKVMKKAFRAAANAILKNMRKRLKTNGHYRSGLLYKSLKTKLKYYKKLDVLVVMVGVKSNMKGTYKGNPITSHKYAHFITKGRKSFTQFYSPFFVMKNSPSRAALLTREIGAVQADNFIAAAVYTQQVAAIAAAKKVLDKELTKK